MVRLHNFKRELLFRFRGMRLFRQFASEQHHVIPRHEFIGNAHQFSEHLARRFGHADKIAEALAHFLQAVQPLKDRQQKDNLLWHAFFALKIASDQDVEKLVGSAQLDISFYHHRVPALHDRILNLVGMDRLLMVDAGAEIFALEHLLQRDATVQSNHIFVIHFAEPLAVEDGFSARRIEYFKRLLAIGLGIGYHMFAREVRARCRPTARIADHPSKIADDQHRLMTEILKLPKLSQNNRMPEMNIGARRIDPEFYAERTSERELFTQFIFADDLRRAALENGASFVR